jgi:hypothetical protein
VDEAAVDAALAAAMKKRFNLVPVRFVEEGGTQMGHTVTCDIKVVYLKVNKRNTTQKKSSCERGSTSAALGLPSSARCGCA